jgi:hypothetical protein
MSHSKCETCQARVWHDGGAADHLADLCPGCAGPLEPITDLSALVGLRCLRARPRWAREHSADRFEMISAQIRQAIARRDAERP